MSKSYLIKSERPVTYDQALEIVEQYKKALSENKVIAIRNDIEIYKIKRGKCIRIV